LRRWIAVVTMLVAGGAACAWMAKKIYPERWVYVSRSFDSDQDVEDVRAIARTASEHGLTAIVLPGMDNISRGDAAYYERLKKVRAIAAEAKLEIIPSGFNTGYGGAVLSHDANLAEGMLVEKALFVAGNEEARFVPDSPAALVNGGFEQFEGNRPTGFPVQDEPGVKTFIDTTTAHSGKASLRIENFGTTKEGVARVAQKIKVTPNRCYRISAWVKTEGAEPGSLFSLKAIIADKRDLSPFEPPQPPTSDWKQVTTAFNSWYADEIELNAGVFEGVKGKVWVDDVRIEEVGLMNVIRREGAPLRVRDEQTGALYEEGRDFAKIVDPKMDFLWTHDMPVIRLLPGSRIKSGTRLRVDYYHGTTIYNDQVSACPSEPRVYEIWKQQFPLIQKHLAPKRYFINIDEVRLFNRCEACKRRKMTPAAMLGQMTQWFYDQVHAVNPKAEVFYWSDMFDPAHNSVDKYYMVDGSLEGTWKYLPKDAGIVCWAFDLRRKSLDFFSQHGFKTVAGAYYDADDLKDPEGWLEALDATPGATGIMYTTWQNKYKLLGPFGDLVSKRP